MAIAMTVAWHLFLIRLSKSQALTFLSVSSEISQNSARVAVDTFALFEYLLHSFITSSLMTSSSLAPFAGDY